MIQVALLITDQNLQVVSPEFSTVIKQSPEAIDSMNDWCKANLTDIAEASIASEVTEAKAESMMLEFIQQHVEERKSPLAGNSIYMVGSNAKTRRSP